MKTISLKIDDSIFVETENILSGIRIPRNRYINEAIEHYNKVQKRQITEKKLKTESALVKKESMNILKDFEKLDYAD
jgi:predicted transcriptional regulator